MDTKRKTYSPYGIISERLKKLQKKMKEVSTDKNIISEIEKCISLSKNVEHYTEKCTTKPSKNLETISEFTFNHDWEDALKKKKSTGFLGSQMMCGHVAAQFLKILIDIMKARNILEIGMFSGFSTLAMAESLPPDGKIVACEFNPYAVRIAKKFFKRFCENRIIIEEGPAIETLIRLANAKAKFDFVFIDATKSQYPQYLKILVERKIVKKGSLICIDNTFLQGKVFSNYEKQDVSSKVMKKFNSEIAANPQYHTVMLPLRDGFTLLRVK